MASPPPSQTSLKKACAARCMRPVASGVGGAELSAPSVKNWALRSGGLHVCLQGMELNRLVCNLWDNPHLGGTQSLRVARGWQRPFLRHRVGRCDGTAIAHVWLQVRYTGVLRPLPG